MLERRPYFFGGRGVNTPSYELNTAHKSFCGFLERFERLLLRLIWQVIVERTVSARRDMCPCTHLPYPLLGILGLLFCAEEVISMRGAFSLWQDL